MNVSNLVVASAVLASLFFLTAGVNAEIAKDKDAPSATACEPDAQRYERGLKRLDDISKGEGQAVVDSLAKTSPDIARYIVEFPYGDVFCRPGLTDQQRELATISALAALGNAEPELRGHIHGALNVGISEKEIIETMILMSVYAGFPAAIHGIKAAESVFKELRQSQP